MFFIGMYELALLSICAVPMVFSKGRVRRWIGVCAAALAVGIVVTPADPLSAMLAAVLIAIVFTLGVFAGPHLRVTDAPSP